MSSTITTFSTAIAYGMVWGLGIEGEGCARLTQHIQSPSWGLGLAVDVLISQICNLRSEPSN